MATFAGCTALTGGVGAIGCAVLAGAAANAVSYGMSCRSSKEGCSLGGAAEAVGLGAAGGALGGALAGPLGGKLVQTALDGVIPEAAASGLVGAGSGAITGAATGAADYGLHCGNACSASGLAGAAGSGALVGGAMGGAFGAAGGLRGGSRAEEPAAGTEEETPTSCLVHSFTGGTRVLMADGSAKPIDQVKVGDQVANSAPGDSRLQTFGAELEMTQFREQVSTTRSIRSLVVLMTSAIYGHSCAGGEGRYGDRRVGSGRGRGDRWCATGRGRGRTGGGAADRGCSVSGDWRYGNGERSTLTTTFHHPFYDITRAACVDAADLHTGDQLQTAGGDTAVIAGLRLYHQTTTTYDLTVNGLHTYYVVAGTSRSAVTSASTSGSPPAATSTTARSGDPGDVRR